MAKVEERRDTSRRRVFGGNAQVTRVIGRGYAPPERARIINWSPGGLFLKVPSPRRRLFRKQSLALCTGDSITLILRLPPAFRDICVRGEVVYAKRLRQDPDQLGVGLRFDVEACGPKALQQLADLLEPKQRASVRLKRQKSA